jgi:hypothetical protein
MGLDSPQDVSSFSPSEDTAMPDFPLTIEAVENHDKSLWSIGEALIKEIGPPRGKEDDELAVSSLNTNKIRDNSSLLFEQCAKRLFILGHPAYTVERLRTIRNTTYKFPAESRHESIVFEAHRSAGSPEKLDEIVAAIRTAREDIRPTIAVVRHVKQNADIPVIEAVKTYTRDTAIQHYNEAKIIREDAKEIANEISPTTPVQIIGGGGGGSHNTNVVELELILWLDEAMQRLTKVNDALEQRRWPNDTLDVVKEKTLALVNQARAVSDKCGKDDPKTRFNVVGEKR